MNRKLLNGMLVLAVAAGTVGTFTSCKDEDFRNDVVLDVASLQAQIDAIRQVTDIEFQNKLQAWLDSMTDTYSDAGFANYYELCRAADAMYQVYNDIMSNNITGDTETYVSNLYDWMFENKISASDWYDLIYRLAERASGVQVNQVYNPVFGTINLPVGINSTVLATYVYKSQNGAINFPVGLFNGTNSGAFAEASPYNPYTNYTAEDQALAQAIKDLSGSVSESLSAGVEFTTPLNYGNMGGAVLSINPTSNDYTADMYTVELVASDSEDAVLSTADGSLVLEEYEGKLTFGTDYDREEATRTVENGLYKLSVNATAENYQDLALNLDKSGLKDAVKELWANKTISNIAHVGEKVFETVNNAVPAYAVKVSWEEPVVDQETGVATGTVTNSVSSKYDLAAIAVQPLSYNTMISAAMPSGKKLPVIHSSLSDKLDDLKEKLDKSFNRVDGVDDVEFNLQFVGAGMIEVMYNGQVAGYISYDGNQVENASTTEFNYFIKQLFDSLNMQLTEEINSQIITDINKAIDDINNSISDIEGQTGNLQEYIERAQNSKYLDYAQKLVDVYNELASKANRFLADPDHYLQVLMAYSQGSGAHHMSNDAYWPETILVDTANTGLELIVTSYNGDVLVPSYKKYVAITGIVNADHSITTDGLDALNQAAGLNVVIPGHQETLPMDCAGLQGKKVRLTYVSVDYHGVASMANYYVTFK